MKFSPIVVFFFLFTALNAVAQDSAQVNKTPREPLNLLSFKDPHSPRKASIYAAVLPGLGQVYNRKYWKVPVVYAALGASTYAMWWNRREMRKLNDQFRAAYKNNPDTSLDANLIAVRDNYRRYRDFSILAMSAFYALQIVDAVVDAHFYKLDIDQDLQASFRFSPSRFAAITLTF